MDAALKALARFSMRGNRGIMPRDDQRAGWFVVKLRIAAACISLSLRNRLSRARVTKDDGDFVVSLTSYGARISTVYLTLESIALSRVLPHRIVLWVSEEDYEGAMEKPRLRRLRSRGVEIRACNDYGPHTKYFPWVELSSSEELETGLITADDDVLYPSGWLDGFESAKAIAPEDSVLCYRGCDVGGGRLMNSPYTSWPLAQRGCAGVDLFPTGVSGVFYPSAVLNECKSLGSAFSVVCPKADDIWLHAVRLRAGSGAQTIDRRGSLEWWPVPRAHRSGLFRGNVAGGGNDAVLRRTLDWLAGV